MPTDALKSDFKTFYDERIIEMLKKIDDVELIELVYKILCKASEAKLKEGGEG